MATLAPQITSTGVITQTYADLLAQLQNLFWSIYGTDAQLSPDTQDGQWLAILAQGYYDCGQAVASVYNAYSPVTAQGAGLSSIVKINGLRREIPSNSQAPVLIVGQFGATITNGLIGDNLNLGTVWALPASVTIPQAGQIAVTATCTTAGATIAPAGSLTNILTPTYGWQSVTNTYDATPGNPVESDPQLRSRQAESTAGPAQTPLESVSSAVSALPTVSRVAAYENDTGAPDANGIPATSIAIVVEGGSLTDIAGAIAKKKAPGVRTYGTTSEIVIDSKGVPNTINFFVLDVITIYGQVTITPLSGFVTSTEELISDAVAAWISALDEGDTVYVGKLWGPANLNGDAAISSSGMTQAQLDVFGKTFNVTGILIGLAPNALAAADIPIAFNQAAAALGPNILIVT